MKYSLGSCNNTAGVRVPVIEEVHARGLRIIGHTVNMKQSKSCRL